MCIAHDHNHDHGHIHGGQEATLIDLSSIARRDLVRALAAGSIAVAAAGCSTNAVTGRRQFVLVDDTFLVGMALDAWNEEKSKTPISNDRVLNQRLRRVGEKIAVAANRPNDPWEFVVFDRPEKNAFVLPGGKVGFYRGLMDIADRDDHIATVMGHEVGHVTGRHAAERFSIQIGSQAALMAVSEGTRNMDPRTRQAGMAALGLGIQFGILLPYSRRDETEADRIGLDYMQSAGYQPRQALTFWQRMAAGGGPRPPEFLSTHPDPANRIRDIEAYINARGW
jgi:predicted Zn-dependent protease